MNTDLKTYKRYAQGRAKKSPVIRDCIWAFCSGGGICVFAQWIKNGLLSGGTEEKTAGMLVSVILIGIASILTAFGVFDKIAKHTGAGTLVPITGFSNGISSSAIDARSEGFVLGVGAKMFQIAGPVILYGLSTGVIYGMIYWIIGL
ncbi:MAG: SpoVA/SpoVAEb family sporulation membrane protein [Ruminococcaceae bacterium]|nr:SpoVA/SpoVAEb family sporulation membrane protein [Oscillospiraceae bacterium]